LFLEKKEEYIKGKIDKNKYMEEMFKSHRHLFEYPLLIKDSPIEKIEITQDQVVFMIQGANKDIKICCDKNDSHSLPMSYLNFSAYETVETNMILRLVKEGDVVFDIGANIGWYTLNILFSHNDIVVYSFEPIKSSYQLLKKNLELNNQRADRTYNFGLSDENKKVKFYFDMECTAASSMADLRERGSTIMEECEVKKMDDFILSISGFNKLDFIKCDVEGSELFVFKGAIETIKRYKPIVFSEILRKWSKKFSYHPNDIINLFLDLDYDCYVINNDKLEKFGYVDEATIQTNYLFFHKDKHAEVVRKLLLLS